MGKMVLSDKAHLQLSMRESGTKGRVDFVHRIQILVDYKGTRPVGPGLLNC